MHIGYACLLHFRPLRLFPAIDFGLAHYAIVFVSALPSMTPSSSTSFESHTLVEITPSKHMHLARFHIRAYSHPLHHSCKYDQASRISTNYHGLVNVLWVCPLHHSCKHNQCFKNQYLLTNHFHGNGSGECGCVLWVCPEARLGR